MVDLVLYPRGQEIPLGVVRDGVLLVGDADLMPAIPAHIFPTRAGMSFAGRMLETHAADWLARLEEQMAALVDWHGRRASRSRRRERLRQWAIYEDGMARGLRVRIEPHPRNPVSLR